MGGRRGERRKNVFPHKCPHPPPGPARVRGMQPACPLGPAKSKGMQTALAMPPRVKARAKGKRQGTSPACLTAKQKEKAWGSPGPAKGMHRGKGTHRACLFLTGMGKRLIFPGPGCPPVSLWHRGKGMGFPPGPPPTLLPLPGLPPRAGFCPPAQQRTPPAQGQSWLSRLRQIKSVPLFRP
jgi:hypothetical protein